MRSRWWVFVATSAASAVAVPLLVFRCVAASGVDSVEVGLDSFERIRPGLARIARSQQDVFDVAYLGDSTVVSYRSGRRVPQRLQEAVDRLDAGGPPIRIHSAAAPGMGAFDYYFTADVVLRAGPDLVLLPFNLTTFSEGWRETFRRPALAGWIAPSRLPEALTLPLSWTGLTADRLFFYVGVVQSGGYPWLYRLVKDQARLGRARHLLTVWLAERLGSSADVEFGQALFDEGAARSLTPDGRRLGPRGIRDRYGRALDGVDPDDPVLTVLGRMVARLEGAGIDVVVYTNPTNLEHVERLGLLDERGLDHTISSIGATVRDAGGELVQLHRLLPDAGFRDAAGHFNDAEGLPDGPGALAEALAPLVVERARAFARRARVLPRPRPD